MPGNDMTGYDEVREIKKDIEEMRTDLRSLSITVNDIKISRAVADERQGEISKKLDILSLNLSNSYVGSAEYGVNKNAVEVRLDKVEGWLTWILRLTVGAVVLAGFAALRLKGGI